MCNYRVQYGCGSSCSNSIFQMNVRYPVVPLIIRGVEASFFTGEMHFLSPNQQCQSTEGLVVGVKAVNINDCCIC